jgi:flagellum-specific peptidoglycan hydrolase FlgJ
MQTQSTCYKETRKMTIKGVLWHSTGANNPNLKRYVQPSDVKPTADTYSKAKWLELLGTNTNSNDWNHVDIEVGLNGWIGKLANNTITSIQTMPWDYRPWGCGGGSKGSCNDGWIQFEICEDGLSDVTYFNKVYKEACELTAYLYKQYNIDPKGSVTHNGVKVPTILCHQDSYKLGLGSNHGDVYHWFNKYRKTMDTVRNDVEALLKNKTTTTTNTNSTTTSNTTSTIAKTYKVVTKINKYTNATDAATQKNAQTALLAEGTYYIYNKYPSGVNGMYNISTDKTGNSAGCWINPKENKLEEDTSVQLYRVRKSKDDAKSQKGAYSILQSAINTCQSAGQGYHVFDKDFKIVYSYIAPSTSSTSSKILEVYELNYPEKTKIVNTSVVRTNSDCTKAIKKILANNSSFDTNIAKAFFVIAPKYGIDPLMAISQAILETGWFKYQGSNVKASQHNYCGLGVTSSSVEGAAFNTIEDGVSAQLQHLYAYGCKTAIPSGEKLLDPRFSLVTRGVATYWQQLAGRWACPGYDKAKYDTPQKAMEAENTYGQKILALCKSILAVAVSKAEVEKYFTSETTQVVTKPEQNTATDNLDNEVFDDAQIEETANALASMPVEYVKKLIQTLLNLFIKGE